MSIYYISNWFLDFSRQEQNDALNVNFSAGFKMENTKHGFSKKADKQLPHERQEAEIKKFRATAMISEKELSELEVISHFFQL